MSVPDVAPGPARPVDKLPVVKVVNGAYLSLVHNWRAFLQIAWLPAALLAIATYLMVVFNWEAYREVLAAEKPTPELMWPMMWVNLAPVLIQIPLMASIAVGWHRFILRGEETTSSYYLRLDGKVWLYAAVGLLIGLLPMLGLVAVNVVVMLLAVPLLGADNGLGLAAILVPLNLVLLGLILNFVTRAALLLPAKAVDHPSLTLGRVLEATRGNFWRILGGTLMATFPPAMALGLLLTPFQIMAPQLSAETFATVQGVNVLLGTAISGLGVGFLSLAYRHFFEGGGEAAGGPPHRA